MATQVINASLDSSGANKEVKRRVIGYGVGRETQNGEQFSFDVLDASNSGYIEVRVEQGSKKGQTINLPRNLCSIELY